MSLVVDDILRARRTGTHAFILTGNIFDVICPKGVAPARLPAAVAAALQPDGYASVIVSRARGFQALGASEERQRELSRWIDGLAVAGRPASPENPDLLAGVEALLRQSERRVAVFVDFAQHFAPSTPDSLGGATSLEQQIALERLHRWGQDEQIRTTQNLLLLLAPEGSFHDLLAESAGYRVLRAGLPTLEDRSRFLSLLEGVRERGRREFAAFGDAIDTDRAAALAAGLRLTDLESLSRGVAAGGERLSAEWIRKEKARIIAQRCGDLLEVLEPTYGLSQVSGLAHVVDYLGELAIRLGDGRRDVPRALLFMGVPGCGKTFVVSALASQLGWNCLMMRSILSKWVGESERNLDKAFGMAEAMMPCVFFIDEIDQALVRRGEGGDAGTSQRMLKRTMEFLAEERHRGRILFVAATNAPHMLDPAVNDRFGVKIPFLHPSRAERAALLPVLAGQLGRTLARDLEPEEIAGLPELDGITVRGLLEVLAMAAHWVDVDRGFGTPLDQTLLVGAARAYRPACNPLQHELIALVAIQRTSFTSLYPWMKRADDRVRLREQAPMPGYLSGVASPEGTLDHTALEERIRELGRALHMDSVLGRF